MSIALIIIGTVIVKVKQVLGNKISYVVIGAGIFTLFSAATFVMDFPVIFSVIGVILSAIWQTNIGFKLYKLGNKGGVQ